MELQNRVQPSLAALCKIASMKSCEIHWPRNSCDVEKAKKI